MEDVYTKCLVSLLGEYSISELISTLEKDYPDLRSTLRGNFRKGNLRVGGVNLRPRKYASKDGFTPVPVISLGPEPYKKLSPFFLGPVEFIEDGITSSSSNVENHFQFHKLYENVDKKRLTMGTKDKVVTWGWPKEVHAIKVVNGAPGSYKHPTKDEWWKPTKEFWRWRETGLHHNFGIRRPNGKTIPIGSLFNGRLMGLVDSRIQLYEPAYRQTAYRSSAFYTILNKLRKGEKLMILDLDGPKIDEYPSGEVADLTDLSKRVTKTVDERDRYFPYGHGYVLCRMLLELLGEK